jgi:hypothetical protein
MWPAPLAITNVASMKPDVMAFLTGVDELISDRQRVSIARSLQRFDRIEASPPLGVTRADVSAKPR